MKKIMLALLLCSTSVMPVIDDTEPKFADIPPNINRLLVVLSSAILAGFHALWPGR